MELYEKLVSGEEKLSLVGLGYVGMPIAVAFARRIKVIGFDLNEKKIGLYKNGIDPTNEVGNEVIKNTKVEFTADAAKLREAKFHIVAVPTPVNDDHTPDLTPVEGASRILGQNLTRGSVVVFESTVYPGVTEDICVPILEKESGLKCGVDFKIGYSPERINPGDKVHRLETIVKIVSGMDEETLDTVAKVYELVVEAGVYRAGSIKVAEAAKVIENSQRDINIAFMNELSIIFDRMGVNTFDVLKAAGTKWNFLPFSPGWVGGHCIGVDPYYLVHKAKELQYHTKMINSGRYVNDSKGRYIGKKVVKKIISQGKNILGAHVLVMGITFKENVSDIRNSKVADIINEFKDFGAEVDVMDPFASPSEVLQEYGIRLVEKPGKKYDAVVVAVAHIAYLKLDESYFLSITNEHAVLADVKGVYRGNIHQMIYWSL